jgi:phosphotransferase system enzyme I (PtsI)
VIRLSGKPISGGSAIGTATVVRWIAGIAQLSPRILEEMALAAKRGPAEPIEVVLVAEDLRQVASLTLPGVRVVGYIAEGSEVGQASVSVPALVGVEGATTKVGEDMLVLLDADRGLALVDPDGAAVAAYQAERERISPRRRIYIDFAHEPARTLDGRLIRVYAVAGAPEAVSAGANLGAEAIFIYPDPEGFSANDDNAQKAELVSLVQSAEGKPVTLIGGLETVAASAVLQAALTADLTLALPFSGDEVELEQARAYLQEVGSELSAAEEDWRPVALAALITPDASRVPSEDDLTVHRIIADLTGVWDPDGPEVLEWLLEWIELAQPAMIPVEAILPGGWVERVDRLVSMGIAAVAVLPEEVAAAKERIGQIDASLLGRAALGG